MSMRRVCAFAALMASVAGCSSGSEANGSTSRDATTTTTAAAVESSGLVALQLQAAGDTVEGVVLADAPIDVTVPFANGTNAVVHVPAAAMESGRPIRVVPVNDDAGDVGLVFEPAGVWLDKPITVTFSAPGTSLVRFGRTDDSLLFGLGSLTANRDVIVARLRPIVLVTQPDTKSAINTAGDRDTMVGDVYLGRGSDGVDPIDELAGEDERDEADEPDGATERGPDARAGAVTQLRTPRCNTYADTKEMAELVELARKEPSVQIPECVEAIVHISGMVEAQLDQYSFSEYVVGEGVVVASAQGDAETLPLVGQEEGFAALRSLAISTVATGGKLIATEYLAPLIPPGVEIPYVPPISDAYCHDGPLRDSSVTVKATLLEGGMLHVEALPTAGVYTITCDDPIPSGDAPSQVWDFLRLLLLVADGEPFTVDMPVLSPVSRLADSVEQVEEATVRKNSDGSVTVSQGSQVVHLQFTLDVSFTPIDAAARTVG